MCNSVLNREQQTNATAGDPVPADDADPELTGQSMLQLQDVKCGDEGFLNGCPPDIEDLPNTFCTALKQWKAIPKSGIYPTLKKKYGKNCASDKDTGPADCGAPGGAKGKLFNWHWDENPDERSQECCTMEEWPQAVENSWEDAEQIPLRDLMTDKALILKG